MSTPRRATTTTTQAEVALYHGRPSPVVQAKTEAVAVVVAESALPCSQPSCSRAQSCRSSLPSLSGLPLLLSLVPTDAQNLEVAVQLQPLPELPPELQQRHHPLSESFARRAPLLTDSSRGAWRPLRRLLSQCHRLQLLSFLLVLRRGRRRSSWLRPRRLRRQQGQHPQGTTGS